MARPGTSTRVAPERESGLRSRERSPKESRRSRWVWPGRPYPSSIQRMNARLSDRRGRVRARAKRFPIPGTRRASAWIAPFTSSRTTARIRAPAGRVGSWGHWDRSVMDGASTPPIAKLRVLAARWLPEHIELVLSPAAAAHPFAAPTREWRSALPGPMRLGFGRS